jgi:16S rRNA (guanine966-N2)-methyltransferase
MTRVIAGTARGRRLAVPPGTGTRPTSDRAREALFSALDAELGGFEDLVVLDLYAGSGALGLEALSRGAAHAVFVEADRRAAGVIAANLKTVGRKGLILTDRAERVAGQPLAAPLDLFDLVLLDPPYAVSDADVVTVLTALAEAGRLADQAVVVLERSSRAAGFPWPAGYQPTRTKTYGEARMHFACFEPRSESQDEPSVVDHTPAD